MVCNIMKIHHFIMPINNLCQRHMTRDKGGLSEQMLMPQLTGVLADLLWVKT
ncbi:hypothetical protein ASN18_2514 [Candidatus Magnetominusculus xianensis]|uniref:Uncharacterized protein n=1 Tax=Candidatus Magnetominusculus xianensis TaxID=1748249 RepID=A0ABR5SCX4_9BACT|nr:hypothetical protein ASN18_2514 [Candidatus Magnetominusculus xianensis]